MFWVFFVYIVCLACTCSGAEKPTNWKQITMDVGVVNEMLIVKAESIEVYGFGQNNKNIITIIQ